jgi:choline dehydrogenase-like flavoprotein
VGEVLKYAFTRKGILSLNPTLVYVFWKSDERVDNHDLQLTFTPASYKEGVQSKLDDEPGMTVASWQQRPDSIGYIRIRSSDPLQAPIIQPNYLSAENDRRVLLAGMKLARRLLASKPLAQYYDHEIFPGPKVQSDDELMEAAKQHLPHGAGQRSHRRARRSAPGARHRGAARGRRLDHADHALGQSQRLGADDRGKSRRHDPRPSAARGDDPQGLIEVDHETNGSTGVRRPARASIASAASRQRSSR